MKRALFVFLVLFLSSAGLNAQPRVESGYIPTDDGTRLFYQKVGTGKQVVIIPGRLFTFDDFQSLAAKDRTLIFYDMRGRGRSDAITDEQRPKLVSIQHDVKDVERVRQYFKASKISLIGYSYLGLMTVMYAMENPGVVERVIQLGPVPLKFGTQYPKEYTNTDQLSDIGAAAADLAKLEKMQQDGVDKSDPKAFCEFSWQVTRYRLVGDPSKVDKLGKSQCEMPNEYPVNLNSHFRYAFVSIQKLDIPREQVGALKIPVLTIHGTKDRNAVYGSGREWATMLPDGRLYTVVGGAHQVWVDEPKVIGAMNTFLKGRWPDGAEKLRP
jgi:pimeloyl-ACP methyl ester carboxylesterase